MDRVSVESRAAAAAVAAVAAAAQETADAAAVRVAADKAAAMQRYNDSRGSSSDSSSSSEELQQHQRKMSNVCGQRCVMRTANSTGYSHSHCRYIESGVSSQSRCMTKLPIAKELCLLRD